MQNFAGKVWAPPSQARAEPILWGYFFFGAEENTGNHPIALCDESGRVIVCQKAAQAQGSFSKKILGQMRTRKTKKKENFRSLEKAHFHSQESPLGKCAVMPSPGWVKASSLSHRPGLGMTSPRTSTSILKSRTRPWAFSKNKGKKEEDLI